MRTAGASSWPAEPGPNSISGASKKENPQKDFSYSEKQLMELFASKIASRGSRGIFGLQKSFKIFDDNRSGDLDEVEFTKAIKDIRLNITTKDIQKLFSIFDRDHSGSVNYDEFLRGIRVSLYPSLLTIYRET
jgi:Ca2+-binding EF-hand superfamily protein